MGKRADMVTMRRAIRNRWPVPAELRTEVLQEAHRLALDKGADPRTRLGALKLILEADRANMAATSLDLQAERIEASKAGASQSDAGVDKICEAILKAAGATDGSQAE